MKNINVDEGREFDWGRTSTEYAKYREEYPKSYFEKLRCFGIGLTGQRILDIGTGTGIVARQFAKNGCKATGIDISQNQINEAIRLSKEQNLTADWVVGAAEDISFGDGSFDVVTGAQCWLYFDLSKLIPKVHRLLNSRGLLMYSFFAWLPFDDQIASKTEELILKYNPHWKSGGNTDHVFSIPEWINGKFVVETIHKYNESVPFTRDSWRGRIRACRGIGASLPDEEVKRFDEEHDRLLKQIADTSFSILHQTCIYVFRKVA